MSLLKWQSWLFFFLVYKIKVCHAISGTLDLMKYIMYQILARSQHHLIN